MARAESFRGRALAALTSIALAIAFPFRRIGAAAERMAERRHGRDRELGWLRRTVQSLSLRRRAPLPTTAPAGAQAREMPWENIQYHPGYGVTVERVVTLFGVAERGFPREQCDLFDDLIEGDCTLRSLFELRAQSVAGKPYVIQAGGDSEADMQAARTLAFAMGKLGLIPFFEHQLSANRYGWGATEIDWGVLDYEGKSWVVPVGLTNVPARRFAIDPDGNTLQLLTAESPAKGLELVPGKWIVTTRPGPLARAGLMRSATWPTCYKRFGTRDWVIYSNKFGLPLVLVSYQDDGLPNGGVTDDPGRGIAHEIVANIGSDGGAVVPSNIKVDIKDAGRSTDSNATHGGLIAYCNAENSKLINGSTLVSDNAGSGGASYALGEVHASVRWDSILYDAALLQESFRTQLAAAFVHFNGINAAAPLLKIQVVRDLAPMARAQVTDIYINKLGGRASATQLSEELGYRAPLNEGDLLPGAAVAAPLAPNPQPDISPQKKAA